MCLRNSDGDTETAEYLENTADLHMNDAEKNEEVDDRSFSHRSFIRVKRLDDNEVINARNYRLKYLQMWSILREISIYLSFLAMLYVVSYSNRDPNAYLEVEHLRKLFLNSRQIDRSYTKV